MNEDQKKNKAKIAAMVAQVWSKPAMLAAKIPKMGFSGKVFDKPIKFQREKDERRTAASDSDSGQADRLS